MGVMLPRVSLFPSDQCLVCFQLASSSARGIALCQDRTTTEIIILGLLGFSNTTLPPRHFFFPFTLHPATPCSSLTEELRYLVQFDGLLNCEYASAPDSCLAQSEMWWMGRRARGTYGNDRAWKEREILYASVSPTLTTRWLLSLFPMRLVADTRPACLFQSDQSISVSTHKVHWFPFGLRRDNSSRNGKCCLWKSFVLIRITEGWTHWYAFVMLVSDICPWSVSTSSAGHRGELGGARVTATKDQDWQSGSVLVMEWQPSIISQ